MSIKLATKNTHAINQFKCKQHQPKVEHEDTQLIQFMD